MCDLGGTEGARLCLCCKEVLGSDTITPARPCWHQHELRAFDFWEEGTDWVDGWGD